MLRRFGMHRLIGATAVCALAGMLLFVFCSKNNPVTPPGEPTWSITVDVLDGYTGNTISGAKVQYMTDSLKDTVAAANAQGRIKIEGLAIGSQSFKITNSDTTTKYTTSVISAQSSPDSLGKLKDVSVTVKLFPLTGSISGKVATQINDLSLKNGAGNVVVSVSYANADLATSSPKAFQVRTDSTGAFSISGIPVANGLNLTVAPATVNAIDFTPDSFALPKLVSGFTVPLGTIVMRPINAKNFKQINQAPLVIGPNEVMVMTYSDPLDSALSYATLEGVGTSQSVKVNKFVSGNKLTITPSISLVDGAQYYLTVYAFGKTGGDTTSKTTIVVKGGGLIDVTSSNVLDGNKKAIDGLGLSDSLSFTFRKNIAKASATIIKNYGTGNAVPIVDTTYVSGATLVVKPAGNGTWEATTYHVKISANLADSSASTFEFDITTIGGLDFVSSNVYNPKLSSAINGLGFTDTIKVTANKPIASATATLSQNTPLTPISMTISTKGNSAMFVPNDVLHPSTTYTFNVTIKTAQGEAKSFTSTFTTASSNFYPLGDNIRFGNDPAKPVLNFTPNGTIFIVMSSDIDTATAQITGGGNVVPTTVTTNKDTLKIVPQKNLAEGTSYNLVVSMSDGNGEVYNANNGNYVTGFQVKNSFVPLQSNVRYNNDASQPVLDFAPYGAIVIKMSAPVQSATASLKTAAGSPVNCNITVATDTIRIVPQVDLAVGTTYNLILNAQSTTGLTYNTTFVTGLGVQNKIRVIASNVLTTDGFGVTNFPVTGTPYYVMSDHFDSTTISIIGLGVDFNLRTNGDTIFVKPVNNLAAATSYADSIKGKTKTGISFAIDNTVGMLPFTTERDVYVVASNMTDVGGNAIANFPIYGTMWVKFSEPLSTDLTKIVWNTAAIAGVTDQLYGDPTKNTYNVSVRVNGDTLFVMPQKSLVTINYGDVIGFGVKVTTASGKIAGSNINFKPVVQSSDLFVAYTNTKDNLGNWRENVGLMDTIIVASSVKLSAIKQVTVGAAGVVPPDVNLDNVKLNATGDTIRYIPSIPLTAATVYSIDFDVIRQDGVTSGTTNVLGVQWTTVSGVRITQINNRDVGNYHAYKVIGDSVVVTFSKKINPSQTIAKRFKVNGFTTNYSVSWSADSMTATIKNLDSLTPAPFGEANPYTSGTVLGTPSTLKYLLTFDLTTKDGEVKSALVPPNANVQIHTEYGIYLVDANFVKVHDLTTVLPVAASTIDTFPVKGSIALTFNRAVDSTLMKAAAPQTYFKLVNSGATTISLDYSMTFSNSGKTITITPVDSLSYNSTFYVNMANVPGLGILYAGTNGKVSGSSNKGGLAPLAINSNGFTTVKAPAVSNINNLTVAIALDTSSSAVTGKRKGSSPVSGVYGSVVSPLNTESALHIIITESAWNAKHADSVGQYIWRVRSVSRTGVASGWYVATARINDPKTWSFNSATNASNAQFKTFVNINAEDFKTNLRKADRDGAGTNYTNGADIFNDSTRIELQVAPVKDLDASGTAGDVASEIGTWSSSLTFVDDIAPCDPNFVTGVNCNDVTKGGVQVVAGAYSDGGLDRTAGAATTGTYTYVLNFPEDMDTSTHPVETIYYENIPANLITISGSWVTARQYQIVRTLPGGTNYSLNLPYYSISVAGMKDASGVSIVASGSVGGAANTITKVVAAGTESQGSQNISLLTVMP